MAGITPDEINRLIAEKVMEWDYDPLGGIGDDNKHPAWIAQDNSWIRVEDFDPYHRIEHAMMALEPMSKRGFYLVLSQNAFSKEWFAKFVNPDNPEKDVKMYAATPSEAICEAIRAALEEKE
jgi:hypothetical protein